MDKSGTFMETQVKQILLQETLFLSFLGMFCTLLCLYHYYLAVPCFNFALSLTYILHFSFFTYNFLPCFCLYHIQLYLSSLLICTLLLFFIYPQDMICTLLCLYPCPAVPCFSFDLYFAPFFFLQNMICTLPCLYPCLAVPCFSFDLYLICTLLLSFPLQM